MYRFRTLLFSGLFVGSVAVANATPIMNEPFRIGITPANGEYSTGNLTPQNPTTTGATGAWVLAAGSNGTVDASGLNYLDPLYSPAESGGKVISGTGVGPDSDPGNTMRNGRLLASGYDSSSTGTVYLSLLIQLLGGDSSPFRGFELHKGSFLDTNRTLQLGMHFSNFGSGTNFGVRLSDSSPDPKLLGSFNQNVNLFVIKFNFSSAANSDSLTVWHNPSLSSGPDPVGGVTYSNIDFEFDRFAFARFPSGTGSIAWDELRMGTSWAEVVPEPSSFHLLLIGSATRLIRGRRRS